ncbi:hypothetical protein SNE40_019655 [Patella caerulea]|uniref:Tc1-like transposase DDE domain-containing protein n=1 Tax=Patella caerulea TaxID=87958 RepID=A0AAN8JBM2_PATCE
MKITQDVNECINRLFTYFEKQSKMNYRRYKSSKKEIAYALNIPLNSVYGALKIDASKTQENKKKKVNTCPTKLDNFDLMTIRETIHKLHGNGQYVSLRILQRHLREKDVHASKTTLYRAISEMGFKYYRNHGKRYAKETVDIVAARNSYLRNLRKYRSEGYEIIYLDETWVNANHAIHGTWTENRKGPLGIILPNCNECDRFIPSGKGSRLIILDAGSADRGFVPDVGQVFLSKTKSTDYHDEMNGKFFNKWFEETLMPALPEPSVIVMDNAPYHNLKTEDSWYPKTNNRKAEVTEWLKKRDLDIDPTKTKAELLRMVTLHRPPQKYKTDDIAHQHGHLVLRLPVRHCELNPIEIIQAQEKAYVARRNTTFKMKDVKRLFLEAKAGVTTGDWAKACQHVMNKVEDRFWEAGRLNEEVPPVVISFGSDSEIEYESEQNVSGESESENVAENMDDGGVANEDSSADNIDVCSVCDCENPPGSESDAIVDWVGCDLCERWMHAKCTGREIDVSASVVKCVDCVRKLYNR